MSRNTTYRARIGRGTKDDLLQAAEALNGKGVSNVPEALDLLLSYHSVLGNHVECPNCGGQPIDSMASGKWHCWNCDEYCDIYDVLDADEPDNADIPVIPRHD
jgi:hypothetical protein